MKKRTNADAGGAKENASNAPQVKGKGKRKAEGRPRPRSGGSCMKAASKRLYRKNMVKQMDEWKSRLQDHERF